MNSETEAKTLLQAPGPGAEAMEYTVLGSTGLVVSRLGFGAMTFGTGDIALNRVGQELGTEMIHSALEAGVNVFDTAATYAAGQSEEFLGASLGRHRDDVVLITKVAGPTGRAVVHRGLSRRHILSTVDASLRRLRTDHIDVLIAHHVDDFTPLEETLSAFDQVIRDGKVRYVGFSNWPAWMAAKAIGIQKANGWHEFATSQSYYSLLGRDIEDDLIPLSIDVGLGLIVWSPLAMGLLTGRYDAETGGGDGGRLDTFEFGPPVDRQRTADVVGMLRQLAEIHSATPARIAIAWLLAKQHVDCVLVGASSMQQLTDNLGAAKVRISNDEVAALDAVSALPTRYPAWLRNKLKTRPGFAPVLSERRPATPARVGRLEPRTFN